MQITLSYMAAFELADRLAYDILGVVISQRLLLVGTAGRRPAQNPYLPEIQAMIRSVPAPDRRAFVSSIRFHFLRRRTAFGHDIRGRDYLEKCRKAQTD